MSNCKKLEGNSYYDYEAPPTRAGTEDLEVDLSLAEIDKNLKINCLSKAEEILKNLADKYSANSEFLTKLGHLMYREKKYSKAEEYYTKALEKAPEDLRPEIHFGLGQVYYQTKLYSDSYLAFTLIVNTAPGFKLIDAVYLKLASIVKAFKDYDSSVTYLMKILKNKNANKKIIAEALCSLGHCYELQGKFETSLKFYKKAGKVFKNFRTISCIAWGFLRTFPKVTESICAKFLKTDKPVHESSDLCFLRALALIKLGDVLKAVELLKTLVQNFPLNSLYAQYLGIAYYQAKEYSKALEMFQSVMIFSPLAEENIHNLSATYRKLGFKAESFDILSKNPSFVLDESTLTNSLIKNTVNKLKIREPVINIYDFPLNETNY